MTRLVAVAVAAAAGAAAHKKIAAVQTTRRETFSTLPVFVAERRPYRFESVSRRSVPPVITGG